MVLGKINWVRWLFFSKKKKKNQRDKNIMCSNMLGFLKGSLTKCLVFMLWP